MNEHAVSGEREPAPLAPAKRPLWTRAFVQVLVANCVIFVSFQMLVPVLPLYVSNIGGSEAVVGLVVGALTFAAVAVRPFVGWFMDQRGRRGILAGSIALFAVAGFAYPLAASLGALLAVRIAQGIGWSGVNPAVSTIVSDLIPKERRGEGLAYQSTSQSLAMAIGPVVGLFVAGMFGYGPVFLTSAALGFCALVLTFGIRDPYTPPREHRELRFRRLVEVSSVAPSAVTALTTFVFGSLVAFVPLDAADRDIGNPAWFFAVFAVTLIVIRPITGRVSDGQTQRGLLILPGLALIAASLVVLAFTEMPWTLAATGLLWGIGFGITQPVLRTMVVDRAPRDRWGAANSTMANAYEVGMGTGALLLGIAASQVGLPTAFASTLLVVGLAAVVVVTAVFAKVEPLSRERLSEKLIRAFGPLGIRGIKTNAHRCQKPSEKGV